MLDLGMSMPYFSHMEKPGWGVVAVIATGIAVLAFFLVFPNQDGKDSIGSDEEGTPTLVDAQATGSSDRPSRDLQLPK